MAIDAFHFSKEPIVESSRTSPEENLSFGSMGLRSKRATVPFDGESSGPPAGQAGFLTVNAPPCEASLCAPRRRGVGNWYL